MTVIYAALAAALLALVAVVLAPRRPPAEQTPTALVFDGWGEGDLRIDEPVPSGRVDEMLHEALETFGFSVVWTAIKECERVPMDDPGTGMLCGRAAVLFIAEDAEPPGWDSPVRFRINVANRHGAPDFNQMSVTAYIPPGWEDYRE